VGKTEADISQSMYEYQKLTAPSGEEYIVRGAKVFCGWGEHPSVLNLPKDHGEVTSDNRPLITVKDSTTENISGFGYCKLIKGTCRPSLSDWSENHNSKQIRNANTGTYEYAVIRSAIATCAMQRDGQRGLVAFSSSGQVVPDYSDKKIVGAIDIIENIRGQWSGSNEKDFLGHIKVGCAGIYHLGINMISNSKNYNGGTVFLYEKQGVINKTLKYIGAGELSEHKNEKLEGFKDTILCITTDGSPNHMEDFYWTTWVTLLLDAGKDYYVEIDCPNVGTYDYKLICSQYFNKKTVIEEINQLMCNINAFMSNSDLAISTLKQAMEDAIKINGVVAIGISGSLGSGLYMSTAGQIVVDMHGNIGLQLAYGAGGEIGASAKGTGYVAVYPRTKDISDIEGFGTEIGGSFGQIFVGSLAALFSGEGDDMKPAGFMAGVGIGVEGIIAEGHIAMSDTLPTVKLGNIITYRWDNIYNNWNTIYSAWNALYSQSH